MNRDEGSLTRSSIQVLSTVLAALGPDPWGCWMQPGPGLPSSPGWSDLLSTSSGGQFVVLRSGGPETPHPWHHRPWEAAGLPQTPALAPPAALLQRNLQGGLSTAFQLLRRACWLSRKAYRQQQMSRLSLNSPQLPHQVE